MEDDEFIFEYFEKVILVLKDAYNANKRPGNAKTRYIGSKNIFKISFDNDNFIHNIAIYII